MTTGKYNPLLFDYLPRTRELNSHFDLLFDTVSLQKNRKSKASRKTIASRHHALRLICCSLLKRTDFVERRCCALSIDPHQFTGVGFSRETFDAVVSRLEMNGYIRFMRGMRTPEKRLLSRLFTTRKLIKFFEAEGFSGHNFSEHTQKHFPKEPIGSRLVEAKSNSSWIYGHKEKGRRINPRYLRANSLFVGQVQLMTELNSFLLTADIEVPNGRSFTGLKRVFNKYSGPEYSFDRGGRLYAQEQANYQQLTKNQRKEIKIDGEQTVELDIHASFLTIAHSFFERPLPDVDDLYETTGVPREVAKNWINLCLTKSAPPSKWPSKTKIKLEKNLRTLKPAKHFKEAILEKYSFLDNLVQSKHCWARLQFIEASIILRTMLDLKQQGICSLPVHDSIIVPASIQKLCKATLTEAFLQQTTLRPIIS